jgi:hypothetical protein
MGENEQLPPLCIEDVYEALVNANELILKSQIIEALRRCVIWNSSRKFEVQTREGIKILKPKEMRAFLGQVVIRYINDEPEEKLWADFLAASKKRFKH